MSLCVSESDGIRLDKFRKKSDGEGTITETERGPRCTYAFDSLTLLLLD